MWSDVGDFFLKKKKRKSSSRTQSLFELHMDEQINSELRSTTVNKIITKRSLLLFLFLHPFFIDRSMATTSNPKLA
jgi:hypothetical protein